MGRVRLADGIGFCASERTTAFTLVVCLELCSLFTAGTMIGFDASGHIAEETKNAR